MFLERKPDLHLEVAHVLLAKRRFCHLCAAELCNNLRVCLRHLEQGQIMNLA